MSHPRTTMFVAAAAGLAFAVVPAAPVSAAPAATTPCSTTAGRPWCDTHLTSDQRAQLLTQAMTTDEKVMFLGGNTGSTGHTGQSYAITRLGIPAVSYTDGPVGPRQGDATAMPVPMAVAATFDPTMAYASGEEIATEAKDKGNDVVFGPTVNMMRTPMGGRTYEAYGEDPFLNTQQTVGWIDGAQSTGVMAEVKHFVGNEQEGQLGAAPVSGAVGSRNVVNAEIDDRTLHEVYLQPFEAAVKTAHVATVMCSYNRINGPFACEDKATLQGILEKDWGFQGYVVSDYGAAHSTVDNLNDGLDFEASGPALTKLSYNPAQIDAALAAGQVTTATIDAHVERILRTWFAYGVFDRPAYVDDDAQIAKAADDAVAEHVEEQAATLLQNTGNLLPLSSSTQSIAVIGPTADSFITGGGSGGVTPFAVTSVYQGLKARASGATVTTDDGSDTAAAVADAKAAQVAVVVVNDIDSEGQDKSCLDLNCTSDLENQLVVCGATQTKPCASATIDQDALIEQVAAANKNTVVVLETSGPVLTPWRSQVKAVLAAWYPGQAGGAAIAHVLYGDVDPAGRSPVTWPVSASDEQVAGNPSWYPGVTDETYGEGVLVGYRWFDAKDEPVAYAFGSGLSYTSFRFDQLAVHGSSVTARVTNTGSRTGTAVPQLYVSIPSTGGRVEPVRQLTGFDKVSLAPGASTTVTFPLTARDLSYWDTPTQSWKEAAGCYRLALASSDRAIAQTVTLPVGGAACGSTSTAPVTTATPPATSTTSSGELAFTGGTGAPAVAGFALVLLGIGARRLRRR